MNHRSNFFTLFPNTYTCLLPKLINWSFIHSHLHLPVSLISIAFKCAPPFSLSLSWQFYTFFFQVKLLSFVFIAAKLFYFSFASHTRSRVLSHWKFNCNEWPLYLSLSLSLYFTYIHSALVILSYEIFFHLSLLVYFYLTCQLSPLTHTPLLIVTVLVTFTVVGWYFFSDTLREPLHLSRNQLWINVFVSFVTFIYLFVPLSRLTRHSHTFNWICVCVPVTLIYMVNWFVMLPTHDDTVLRLQLKYWLNDWLTHKSLVDFILHLDASTTWHFSGFCLIVISLYTCNLNANGSLLIDCYLLISL